MKDAAAQMVTHPERCDQFGQMVRALSESEGTPALIHCSAGKDRTGWAASLMLLTLGVDEGEVIAHYLESNARMVDRSSAAARLREALCLQAQHGQDPGSGPVESIRPRAPVAVASSSFLSCDPCAASPIRAVSEDPCAEVSDRECSPPSRSCAFRCGPGRAAAASLRGDR